MVHWLLSIQLTKGGFRSFFKSILLVSVSSLVISRSSCPAALCSAGNKLGLYCISSRNSMVSFLSLWSSSKSCACFETQWRRTLRTRIVAAVDITDSRRRFFSRQEPLLLSPRLSIPRPVPRSGGLLEADVAIAKAVAAVDVLLLKLTFRMINRSRLFNRINSRFSSFIYLCIFLLCL